MNIICPNCNNPVVDKEAINKEQGYALCDNCEISFLLSDVPDVDASGKQEPQSIEDNIKNPPKGAYINEYTEKTIIGTSLRSIPTNSNLIVFPVIVGVIVFMSMFSYAAITNWIIPIFTTGGAFAYPPTYFYIILSLLICISTMFLIGGFILTILMIIGGKVVVVLEGKNSYVFTGIGEKGIKKKFDWNSTKKVYKRVWTKTKNANSSRSNTRTYYEIIIEEKGKNKINFGGILQGLYDTYFHYILAALKYYHEKNNGR